MPTLNEQTLIEIFDRQTELDLLGALQHAMQKQPDIVDISRAAIGLDTNVLLRLSNHHKGVDITDYFSSKHKAPLIMPGQTVQEFWNNQLNAVETFTSKLSRQFNSFKEELNNIDPEFNRVHDAT